MLNLKTNYSLKLRFPIIQEASSLYRGPYDRNTSGGEEPQKQTYPVLESLNL